MSTAVGAAIPQCFSVLSAKQVKVGLHYSNISLNTSLS